MSISPDTISLMVAIVAIMAVIAMRIAFETWQFKRHRVEVLSVLVSQRAIDPYSARRPEEMGLRLRSFRFGLRDHRSETLGALMRNGFIQRTVDGRIYLSPEACRFYIDRSDK